MNKKEIFTFRGVNQDVTKSKHPKEFYYEGNNIRITSTDSQTTGSVTNEKGTVEVLTIPTPVLNYSASNIAYGNNKLSFSGTNTELEVLANSVSQEQVIIGATTARDNIIVFSTDNNGFDCIWEIDKDYSISLLYMRDLGFSTNNPIQAIFNFENENIQKVYWADGKNQLRFLNTRHSKINGYLDNLIDVSANTINIVGKFRISQPKVVDIVSGGTHTAGMVQYAYNLYRLNSSQTKLSPLTELVPLNKGGNSGGGDLNEIVGSTPVVEITNIDPEYTHIKVYAVKYTSYNQIPTVSLIKDQEIGSTRTVNVFDDGSVINDITLSEFTFLGSDPIIPKHIETKDNYLFSANVKEQSFDVELDTRAYAHNIIGNSLIYNNIQSKFGRPIGELLTVPDNFNVPKKHDAVNLDYVGCKYQKDGVTLGGEGKYIKYELIQDTTVKSPEKKQFFKDNEVYRIGIKFINSLGQESLPKWIADFRAPEGNLEKKYNTIKVTLKPEFYVWLNTSSNFESENDKPVGYRILRANRTANDKTVISQGILNGFMSNYRTSKKATNQSSDARQYAEDGNKLPSLLRPYGKHHTQMEGMKHYERLDQDGVNDDEREVHKASSSENMIAQTFQYNTMMQLFSPDVMFGNVSTYEGLSLRVKGALENNTTSFWGQERRIETKEIIVEGKVTRGLTPHEDIDYSNTGEVTVTGDINQLANFGIYGPAHHENSTSMDFYQFYRDFTKSYIPATRKVEETIYGKPEVTEKGQGATNYNGDPNFKFYNTLQPMIADGGDGRGENSAAMTSVNSWGAKCITLVLGPNSIDYPVNTRPKLEALFTKTGINKTNVVLVGELVKNSLQVYLGGIYGGTSYEDKKRTSYIEIGDYNNIETDSTYIQSPGDTFVHTFRFGKFLKTDTEVYSGSSKQISEIVECIVETDIDLVNRSDESLAGWDSRFQPRYDEYHNYNRVYSQQPTLLQSMDVDYNFRRIKNFDTRIMASKVKVPGEFIDSWTDMLVNEVQDLNGKFGPINSLISFRDNIFALQDKAIAHIAINPRVQVQGGDGIAVELGAGGVLHDYEYKSTTSGTLNKWAVASTDNAIYYLDATNKCFNRFTNQVEKLSDIHGLHSWFQNKVEYDIIKEDNPILNKGAHIGYDLVNNTVMLTLNQTTPYTRLFSEATNSFIGLMDYKPSMYICHNSRLFSIDRTPIIHEHFKGNYNQFYGTYYPSYITLLVNPDVNFNCVFDNFEFNSEMYLDNLDVSNKTLTHIHAYNEYQDSGRVALVNGRGSNLRRRFRTWHGDIPRQGRQRMRNPWLYVKFELDNTDNYKLVLHDIIISYTVS